MMKTRNFINKLSKLQKITCLILLLGVVLLLSIGIPTLARYKNRSMLETVSVWDGTIASSYRDGAGTESDPYVISNGSELAYFSSQLTSNNYENNYFELNNDIVLNNGTFNYDINNGIQYILNSQTYYVDEYTNKYYDNVDRSGTEIGTINIFSSLDSFKGDFNGNSFRIYGLYTTSENNDEIALFTNLQGSIKDLYVENTMAYGGVVTAGIASSTTNASLTNILFDGYVIGKNILSNQNITSIPTSSIINIENTEQTDYIDLANNIPFTGSEIVSTSITGSYVINGATEAETTVKINNTTVTNGSFEINLGSTILNTIPVLTSTTSTEDVTLTFSNLSYNIVYKYAVAGGIVGKSDNTTVEKVVNKAFVYGYSTSGGLVGVTNNTLNINRSYNNGNIDSEYVSGGLIGTIEKSSNNVVVSKSYNSGDMTATDIGGLIGVAKNNSGSVSISNIFNTSTTNYSIGTISNTTVNVSNAYYVNGAGAVNSGSINGSFDTTTLTNLKSKNYVVTNLLFNEFISFDNLASNNENAWVYDYDSLPILFVDDIANPIANIHVSTYAWNNLSFNLRNINFGTNIAFSIEAADALRPIKETYYYISNSATPLTQAEISAISTWTSYSDVVQMSTEGFYVVYVKIVDNNDNITYLNTDLLILDLSGSSVDVSLDDNTWNNLRSSLDYVYIDRQKNISITATDDLSGIESIKYYITDDILSSNDLNALSDSTWTTYSNGISISDVGTYIIYAKITDNFDHVTYVNTDYIVLNGYTENTITIGRNTNSYLNADPYITNKSAITLNISYSNTSNELTGYTHNLMSNILLPVGTKLTLIDNINSKVYKYQITTSEDIYNYNDSCDIEDLTCIKEATYPLTLFKEVGTNATDKPFTENTYYNSGTVNEDFKVILDLFNTNITTNHTDVKLYMELHNSSDINVRPTLYSSIKAFNIYSTVNSENTNASLSLSTNYSGNNILYNSNSTTDINITSELNYKYLNSFKIIDTTYEDKQVGLSIKLVDSEGNTIDKDYLENFIIKVGNAEYYPKEDNIIRISLNSGITDVTKTLIINTKENNSDLDAGTYYFKISNYISDDGYYYDSLGSDELSIPVVVSSNIAKIPYSFNVITDDSNRIISKNNSTVNVSFNILQNGLLDNPNIRVSLYKKNSLTAFNQIYSIVDLANYVSNNLTLYASNIYYVSTNPVQYNETTKLYNNFSLNLITNNFENTGYKYVFDLYDDTIKIGTIEKHFIVR